MGRNAAFTAVNRSAALPALKDGERVCWKSNAILQYAAGFAGETDNVHKLTGLLVARLGMQLRRRPCIVTNGPSCRSPVPRLWSAG